MRDHGYTITPLIDGVRRTIASLTNSAASGDRAQS
jgi:hypothetical protein